MSILLYPSDQQERNAHATALPRETILEFHARFLLMCLHVCKQAKFDQGALKRDTFLGHALTLLPLTTCSCARHGHKRA